MTKHLKLKKWFIFPACFLVLAAISIFLAIDDDYMIGNMELQGKLRYFTAIEFRGSIEGSDAFPLTSQTFEDAARTVFQEQFEKNFGKGIVISSNNIDPVKHPLMVKIIFTLKNDVTGKRVVEGSTYRTSLGAFMAKSYGDNIGAGERWMDRHIEELTKPSPDKKSLTVKLFELHRWKKHQSSPVIGNTQEEFQESVQAALSEVAEFYVSQDANPELEVAKDYEKKILEAFKID